MNGAPMRTQVAIVGAGPAGLFLSHLLFREGIDCVVLEARSRDHIEGRVRAGVLEQGTVDLMHELGLGTRMRRDGMVDTARLTFDSKRQPHPSRSSGAHRRQARSPSTASRRSSRTSSPRGSPTAGRPRSTSRSTVSIAGIDKAARRSAFRAGGAAIELACDIVAGCDGFHGVCRDAFPPGALTIYERVHPFGWVGILAEVAPSTDELIYADHERGFALHSLRSPRVSRHYLQVDPDENARCVARRPHLGRAAGDSPRATAGRCTRGV